FSVLVYVVTGSGLYFLFKRIGRGFDDLVYLSLLAISFNSVVILTEVLFPFVRDVIESFLIPSGNVNWREGFRYRGIASGGGASLSVLVAVAVVFALYLYQKRYIGVFTVFSLIAVLLISLF